MKNAFPLVGIGASAGGLEALQDFAQAIPSGSGLAYIVVQHLAPDHLWVTDKQLNTHSKIDVTMIKDGETIEPNRVYVVPPGPFLEIDDGKFRLKEHAKEEDVRTPIDHFFVSLADAAGANAFGVILSDTGSDGAPGVRAIKSAGGVAIFQESSNAQVPGMPVSADSTGMIDFILSRKCRNAFLISSRIAPR